MVEKRSIASRRDAMLHRLGGQPGRYAVATVVFALLWFPFRLLFDRGDPRVAFLILCLSTGLSWGYTVFFGVLLLAILAVALRNHRRLGRMSQ
jgi:hypothetical protein